MLGVRGLVPIENGGQDFSILFYIRRLKSVAGGTASANTIIITSYVIRLNVDYSHILTGYFGDYTRYRGLRRLVKMYMPGES